MGGRRKPKGMSVGKWMLINMLEAPKRPWDSQDRKGPVSEPPKDAKKMHLGRPGQLLFIIFAGGGGMGKSRAGGRIS